MWKIGRVSKILASKEEWISLLTSRHHQAIFQRERSRSILLRVRLIATIFTVFPLVRFSIGLLVMPWLFHIQVPFSLDAGLIAAALAFAALAFLTLLEPTPLNARLAIGLLLLIPSVYFLFSRLLIAYAQFNASVIALDNSDLFLPFMIMTFVSVFPLVFLEIMVIDIALITVFAIPLLFGFAAIPPDINDLGILWFMFMIAVISLIASISQLHAIKTLFTQAATDPLTRLYNRRSGEALLALLYAQAQRHRHPLSIGFLDLDNFKLVNDQWGHEAGDAVLREAADLLRSGVRVGDVVARWGGEEFVVFMPYATAEEAKARLDGILGAHTLQKPDGHYMSMSGGIAELWSEHTQRAGDLVGIADRRMYAAKAAGKDRIITTEHERPSPVALCDQQRKVSDNYILMD